MRISVIDIDFKESKYHVVRAYMHEWMSSLYQILMSSNNMLLKVLKHGLKPYTHVAGGLRM